MEDSPEKLDLLLSCWISKWHPITGKPFDGFSTSIAYMIINARAQRISKGDAAPADVAKIWEYYNRLKEKYDAMPWDEIDVLDPAFSMPATVYNLLDTYEKRIEDLIAAPNKENYERFSEVHDLLGSDHSLRSEIKSLYHRLEEKLDVMLSCWLGKWHPITGERFRDSSIQVVYNAVNTISYLVLEGRLNQRQIDSLRENYASLKERYDALPWDKIDITDPAFSTPVLTYNLLDAYGDAIESLISEQTEESMRHLLGIHTLLTDAEVPFKREIQELYEKLQDAKTI